MRTKTCRHFFIVRGFTLIELLVMLAERKPSGIRMFAIAPALAI